MKNDFPIEHEFSLEHVFHLGEEAPIKKEEMPRQGDAALESVKERMEERGLGEESVEEEQVVKPKRRRRRRNKSMRYTSTLLLIKNLPYIFFLGFLAILYIANAHYAEKKVRQIQVLQKELKEQRWRYMSMKSDLMYKSKQVEVAKMVKSIGLKELTNKPKKITLK